MFAQKDIILILMSITTGYLPNSPYKILNETGFSNIWQTQTFKSIEWLKRSIKQTLLDQFLQDWNSSVHNSPKAFNHRIFKTDFN
jgi:hypothetical protein